jgi:hypothetical protein
MHNSGGKSQIGELDMDSVNEIRKAAHDHVKSDLPSGWALDFSAVAIYALKNSEKSRYRISISVVSSDFYAVCAGEETYMITKEIDIALMCLIDIVCLDARPSPAMRECHLRHMSYLGKINKAFLIKNS